MRRLGVLLSGRGSNFEAIARAIGEGRLEAAIAVVISNKAEAAGLETARRMGFSAVAIPSKGVERARHDALVADELERHGVDLVCLAGYMRLLTPALIKRYPERILNIHPSLLPAFPGLDAQKQAWEHGVRVAGCTVHLVNEALDAGPIVMQAAVPVLETDTIESLSHRILAEEHRIYSQAIARVLRGGWRVDGRRIVWE